MTLANLVQSNTNHGHTVIDFLIDVMHGRLNHFKPCHRLSAARLLLIYGHQDAADYIPDRSPPDTFTRPATRRSLRIAGVNPELARLIKSQTDNGRSIIDFVVAVMEGRIRNARPHHRMAAARDLLERGFGKLPHRRLPTPPRSFRSLARRQHRHDYSIGTTLADPIARATGDPDHTDDAHPGTASPDLPARAIDDARPVTASPDLPARAIDDARPVTASSDLPTHATEDHDHTDTPDPAQDDTPEPEAQDTYTEDTDQPSTEEREAQPSPNRDDRPDDAPSPSPSSTPTHSTTDPQSRKSPNHTNHSSDRGDDARAVPSRRPAAIPTFDPNTFHY